MLRTPGCLAWFTTYIEYKKRNDNIFRTVLAYSNDAADIKIYCILSTTQSYHNTFPSLIQTADKVFSGNHQYVCVCQRQLSQFSDRVESDLLVLTARLAAV